MRTSVDSERRGAVFVETALMTPLLVVILVGIVEMALLMRDDAALSSLVRDGARSASSTLAEPDGQPRQVAASCTTPACSPDSAPTLTEIVATALEEAGAPVDGDGAAELWVYRPNAQGYPGEAGNSRFDSCVSACVVYRWNLTRHRFDYAGGSWHAAEPTAGCTDSQDAVGVYLRTTHVFLTRIFSGVDISDHAVFSLARSRSAACATAAG
jgi:hypothetical protein